MKSLNAFVKKKKRKDKSQTRKGYLKYKTIFLKDIFIRYIIGG